MKAGQRRDVVDCIRHRRPRPPRDRRPRRLPAPPCRHRRRARTGGAGHDERGSCGGTAPARPAERRVVSVTFEPVWHGRRSDLLFGLGERPELERRIRISRNAGSDVLDRAHLHLETTDERLARSFERSLTDLASLRIFDPAAPTNVVVAAGAPWFMTVFGRDSLLTAWMALPFVPDLAVGVLTVLGNLQGSHDPSRIGGGAGQDPPRTASRRRLRCVRRARPLLRHGRRHPAVRHARRGGASMGTTRRRRADNAVAPRGGGDRLDPASA